jgi:chorismate synthase
MSSSWGEKIRISIFGGSHTKAIGVNIEGLPAGFSVDWPQVLLQMARRAPGQDSTSTKRVEKDLPEVLCGMSEEGVLTGAPLCAVIHNTNQYSKDYSDLKVHPRPGHGDYTGFVKYKGYNDVRGGGHFSGRLTAPLVFAGAICRQILAEQGVVIGAHVLQIGSVTENKLDPVKLEPALLQGLSQVFFPVLEESKREAMRWEVEQAAKELDSLGGVIECGVTGLPVGLGTPMFGGVENVLSSILFGIPAVKAVEFGEGFGAAGMRGSQHNDPFYWDGDTVCARTNHAGGILGGITNGMPLVFRVAVKPTPSIGKNQETVDLQTKESYTLSVKGRHDPCIVPRAVPVVEAAAAVALLDLFARDGQL